MEPNNVPPQRDAAFMRPRLGTYIVLAGLTLGVAASTFIPRVLASRNGSGTYTLPAGNPVVSGTAINPTVHNATMSDIATALTGSIATDGSSYMSAPLRCSSGTVGAPSLTFSADTDTGLYRIGANNPGMSAGGVKVQEWSATGSTFPLTMTVTGTATHSGASTLTGLATFSDGIVVSAPSTANRKGIDSTGNGTGDGIYGTGGATDGRGGTFFGGGSNGPGLAGTGIGTAYGVAGVGGATGNGVVGIAGGSPTANTNSRWAFEASSGHMHLSGGNPNSNTAFSNALTPMNIVKAWARLSMAGAGVSVGAGFNVTAACGGTGNDSVVVTFGTGMANTAYVVIAQTINSATLPITNGYAAGSFSVSSAAWACDTGTAEVNLIVLGPQ